MEDFRDAVQELLNKGSRENRSGTPDFILARYLEDCLFAFDKAVSAKVDALARGLKQIDKKA